MLILSLVFSVVFFCGACGAYKFGEGSGARFTLFLVCGLLAAFFSLTLNPTLLTNVVLLLIAGAVCRGIEVRTRRFTCVAVLCTLLVYGVYGFSAASTHRERERIRQRHPIESMAARLEYERRWSGHRASAGTSGSPTAVEVPPRSTSQRLDALEQALEQREWPWRSRSEALRIVHSSYVEQFIESPGFGVGRMMPMREPEKYADAREPKVIYLPLADFLDLDGTSSDHAAIAADPNPIAPPESRQLETMHEESLFDFVNRRGWGYVRDRDHVAGFQPHQFRNSPVVPAANAVEKYSENVFDAASSHENFSRDAVARDADQNWAIRKVELVSLLKHDEPSVYISDELPRMDRLAEVPVRPLDNYERQALETLERGEDVATGTPDSNRIRMLGAIRAARSCLKCHSVERGELLGAFSYVLERTRPAKRPASDDTPAY